MRIRRFEAPTVQEALSQVRQELGPEAVILYTRKLKKGGFFGIGSLEVAEITAGLDDPPPPSASAGLPPLGGQGQGQLQVEERVAPARTRSRYAEALASSPRKAEVFQSELNEGKVLAGYSVLRQPQPRKAASELHPELARFQKVMEKNGVEEEVAGQLLRQVNREINDKGYPRAGTLQQLLGKFLAAAVKVSGPIETMPGKARVVAFIGPTGVGKTTNLVKLASQYSLIHQMKVALLTADTYRIGAVEQLKIYRDIIDIPFEAVSTPQELKDALKRYADRDLIFFDTAGRSPQNRKQLTELRTLLEAAEPAEVHLVISATTKNSDLLPIVGKFGLVPINRFLVTKLDETRTHGMLLNLSANFSIPVSYLSHGQNVPNDIEVATPERVAELVLGEARG